MSDTDEYERIQRRFEFEMPVNYQKMQNAGFFESGNLNYLFLTDLEWLSLAEIAAFEFLEFQIDGLVPFAKSARKDLYCWYPRWAANAQTPIVFCPRTDNEASGFARDFSSFIYRALLEEFSGSWLVETFGIDGTTAQFRKYAEIVKDYIPQRWSNALILLAQRPLKELEPGVFGVFTREECDLIIESELRFPRLNQTLKQYI
jgi:hypothetical protein